MCHVGNQPTSWSCPKSLLPKAKEQLLQLFWALASVAGEAVGDKIGGMQHSWGPFHGMCACVLHARHPGYLFCILESRGYPPSSNKHGEVEVAPWKTLCLYEQAVFHFHHCFTEGVCKKNWRMTLQLQDESQTKLWHNLDSFRTGS